MDFQLKRRKKQMNQFEKEVLSLLFLEKFA